MFQTHNPSAKKHLTKNRGCISNEPGNQNTIIQTLEVVHNLFSTTFILTPINKDGDNDQHQCCKNCAFLTLTLAPTWSPLTLQGSHVLCRRSLAPLPGSSSVFSIWRMCMSVEACFIDLTANLHLFMYQQRWKDTRRIEERQKLNAERTWAQDAPCSLLAGAGSEPQA